MISWLDDFEKKFKKYTNKKIKNDFYRNQKDVGMVE